MKPWRVGRSQFLKAASHVRATLTRADGEELVFDIETTVNARIKPGKDRKPKSGRRQAQASC